MDTFFLILRKTLVATTVLLFVFSITYIPQDWNQIESVRAAGGVGNATEVTQIANNAQLLDLNVKGAASLVQETVTAAQTTLSAGFDALSWNKELVLDGIAWAAAKAVVQGIVDSLVSWIKSGFKGKPAFVEDLGGFLLETADLAAGKYISELGGVGSFLCSPFKLDISVALNLKYDEILRHRGERPVKSCSLTKIAGNIEDFISGIPGSFDQGGPGTGWDNWFEITGNPNTYTKYGSYLAAESGLSASLINAQGQELEILKWGDGFLSGTLCETVHGAGSSKDDCFINKPGKIIEEALTFNLDSGRQSLVTADEINEIIAALLQQLASKVLTGANGLFS